MNKICLCITNYKKEEYLERSIRSCLTQIPYEIILEIIVVNDGSKNFNKTKIQKEFPSIKILEIKNNKGVSFASNLAIKNTKSEYYLRVDADDYLSMKSCLILSSILEANKNIPFVYGDILKIYENGNIKKIKRDQRDVLLNHGAGIMFRTSQLKKIKGYNIKLKNCEDFDLILRVEKKYGKGFYVPIPYYRYYKTTGEHLTSSKNRNYYLKRMKIKYAKYL
tara:strand:- start:347 stop:1012 length:666 start_codon:yes stop_codon:yes gene_type:complete